ncbi:MAG: hypothetical protein JWO47_89 [Candidatus Saccharibacteria bacterium]|nr:hypothetical protein [Candidatus Saccharibacteria bacterium]
MAPQMPEQLSLNIDTQFPRQHIARDIRTLGELASDGFNFARKHVEAPLKMLARYGIVAGLFLGGDADTVNLPVVTPVAVKYVECNEGTYNPDDLSLDLTNYSTVQELAYSLEAKRIGSFADEGKLLVDIEDAKTVDQASREVSDYMLDRGLPLSILFDGYDKDGNYKQMTKEGLLLLVVALHTIPKSMYDYSEAPIIISPYVALPKSKQEIETEAAHNNPDAKKNYGYYGGLYENSFNTVTLSFDAVNDKTDFILTALWHEYVGHAVLDKECNPLNDLDWRNINALIGPPVGYMPSWHRTPEQEKFFSEGIQTVESYGGMTVYEDVATIVESYLKPNWRFYGNPISENHTVVDEKQDLLLKRLSLIEPDIANFIMLAAHQRLADLNR